MPKPTAQKSIVKAPAKPDGKVPDRFDRTLKTIRPSKLARPRSADQIGRTALGSRPIPELTQALKARVPSTAAATLDSGLNVVAVRKPGTPLIEVRLRIPFGGKGLSARVHSARAEVLASSVLLGTERRTREQVDEDLGTVGGHLDASVDSQRLMIAGSVLSTGLEVLLEVMADSLTGAAFRSHDVGGERDRLVEQLAIASSQPSTVARKYLQHRRFGDHPAAWDMPDATDVAAVTTAGVRGLFRRQVVPVGSTLVLVGDLSPAKTLAMVAKALGDWHSDRQALELSPPPQVAPGPLGVFDRPGAVQSQVRLSAPAVGRDHDGYAAQQLANLIYAGYFSSRLVENIREDKGYTYSASSSVHFWPGAATVTIGFDTNTESTAPAVWEAYYELGRLALLPPTVDEVESARNYALGTLATSLATQAGYAATISSLAAFGLGAEWLAGHRANLARVTADEVHSLARAVFAPSAFMGVVVGDAAQFGAALSSVLPVELP